MRLIGYVAPIVVDYRSAQFPTSIPTAIDRAVTTRRGRRRGAWVMFGPVEESMHGWQPKLYLCPRARDYWTCVDRLLRDPRMVGLTWKFFRGPVGFDRPDKIILHVPRGRRLGAVENIARAAMAGLRHHDLRHAAACAGLSGVFRGSDPAFLRLSWRYYRALAVAWAALNRRYLASSPGGIARWMRRMNLSTRDEGPRALLPAACERHFIRRTWRSIARPA